MLKPFRSRWLTLTLSEGIIQARNLQFLAWLLILKIVQCRLGKEVEVKVGWGTGLRYGAIMDFSVDLRGMILFYN